MNTNAKKYYDLWKLLYNMDEKDLDSEKANKIYDECDTLWNSLTDEDRTKLHQKIDFEVKNER